MNKVYSAIVYLLTFFISSLLFRLAYSDNRKGNNVKRSFRFIILWSIAALIPCLVAGYREVSVGADIKVYGLYFFNRYGIAKADFITSKYPMFAMLARICGLVSGNIHFFLFSIELLILIPVMVTLDGYKNSVRYERAILYFYFLFFNYSLNIMRQTIACSLLFFAYHMYRKKKIIIVVILVVIATGFHPTALLYSFLACVIFALFRVRELSKYYPNIIIITTIVLLTVFALWKSFASGVISIPFLKDLFYSKYIMYTRGNAGITSFMMFEGLFRTVLMFLVMVTCKYSCKSIEKNNWELIQYFSLLSGMVYVFSVIFIRSGVAYRITELFDYFVIVYLCLVPEVIVVKVGKMAILQKIIDIVLVIHWLLAYIIVPSGMGFQTEYFRFAFR